MINVAILGFGTVGSGVAEVIYNNKALIADYMGEEVALKYVLDVHDFPDSIFADRVIHDFSIIEQDPEVDVVVETIGGARIALEFTRRALMAGKSVVTSNKELVATHGVELMKIAEEKQVSYLFEASVGGGIPVIRPMCQCLAANRIEEIYGILNGTTNYILTRMIRAGLSFEDALKEAQQKGYAEQDPTADIEGADACRKICILASLAVGRHIAPEYIPTEGITGITLQDVDFAKRAGMKIKLLGRMIRREDDKVCAYVAPHLVAEDTPMANVVDVFNAINVRGNAVGDVMFYGQGAGKMATASAVVADILDAAKRKQSRKRCFWTEGGADAVYSLSEVKNRWYVRASDLAEVPAGCTVLSKETDSTVAFLTEDALSEQELLAKLPQGLAQVHYRVLD